MVLALLCVALSGCSVALYGNQSSGNGATLTTTSTHVSGSTHGSHFRVSFSSGGHPVPPKASGGYVAASGSAAYVLVGIVALADFWNHFLGAPQAKPLPPGTRIADTCSCYGYKPE